jgi:hypothetical protein
MTTLGDVVGLDLVEEFASWDFSEIQKVLQVLQLEQAIDLAHAELLQQKSLRGADLAAEYLAKIVKSVSYLESKLNVVKNKASLEYSPKDVSKVTADMRKQYGESSPETELWAEKLARARGAKSVLEKKFDLLIKSHYYYKELAMGFKKSIPTEAGRGIEKSGWE